MEEAKVKTAEEIQYACNKVFKLSESLNPSGTPKDWCDTSFKEGYRLAQSHITKLEAKVIELEKCDCEGMSNRVKYLKEHAIKLEAVNKKLTDALDNITDRRNDMDVYEKYDRSVYIAEQALNNK